jgi:DNA modification methylase
MATVENQICESDLGKIHQGDCLAWLNNAPAGSVDLVFADPPFNIGYKYDVYDDRREEEHYLDWSREWMGAVHRILKDDGTFWLAIGDEYAAELKVEAKRLGFHCRSWVIWYYTFGVNCKYKFSRSHAHLFHFVKNLERCTFRAEELENRIPSARMLVYADRRTNPSGRLPDDTWILRPQDLEDRFSPEEDTWYFSRVAGTFKERAGFHGCQMPEQLLGRIIRFCSREGELVLDPFAGSATTLVVAKKLGRRFVGCELSEDYVQRGTERLARVCVGDPLEGGTEPKMTQPTNQPVRGSKNQGTVQQLLFGSEEADKSSLERAFSRGLTEAFRKSHAGHSVERVVLDPDLNGSFHEQCRKLGLAAEPRTWNQALFDLRKGGELVEFPVVHPTGFSWEECDGFLHASELAWWRMLNQDWPDLDEILWDPSGAEEFDRLAERIAPGFSPLQYRWGALKLRKAARVARMRAKVLRTAKFRKPKRLQRTRWKHVPDDAAGVYQISSRDGATPFYVGQTLRIGDRLRAHRDHSQVFQQGDPDRELVFRWYPASPKPSMLLAHQAALIRQYQPTMNVSALASV